MEEPVDKNTKPECLCAISRRMCLLHPLSQQNPMAEYDSEPTLPMPKVEPDPKV